MPKTRTHLLNYIIGMGRRINMRRSAIAIEGQQNCHKELIEECTSKEDVQDYISKLTDDILISIISGLTAREATATSTLSKRWRHLYAHIDHVTFLPLQLDEERYDTMVCNYSHMINGTLHSHKGKVVKELKLEHLPLYEGFNYMGLIEFALSKKVEKISISMHQMVDLRNNRHGNFWDWKLVTASMDGLSFPHLKELALSGVHVDDDYVGILPSKAPLLERLSISDSLRLRNVSIIGHPRLKLKRLHISNAGYLESVEVVDMINLVSLSCSSFVLKLSNVPKLIELGISTGDGVDRILSQIPRCVLDQIRTLKLWTSPRPRTALPQPPPTLPQLINVSRLEIEVGDRIAEHASAYLIFCRAIEAWTSLKKLEIKLLGDPEDPYIEKVREKITSTPIIKEIYSVRCVECCSSLRICCRRAL